LADVTAFLDPTHLLDTVGPAGTMAVLFAECGLLVGFFVTVLAGVSRMDLRRYAFLSVVGGIAWAGGLTALGAWLGHVAVVREHVELFVLAVVAVSLLPVVIEVVRSRRAGRATTRAA
jgi:membrane-associated protein